MNGLQSISPLDGRYHDKVSELSDYFSEFALMKKRIFIELMYLVELGKTDRKILAIHDDFDLDEAKKVKAIEKKTNHDVKAIEYYLKEKVRKELREFVHLGMTSEDVNNLAYSLLIKDFMAVFTKRISSLTESLHDLSLKHKSLTMLAHTHGQPASPTTFGKEFFVFYSRLSEQHDRLKSIKLRGKFNGASGNYNALLLLDPSRNWLDFSRSFISRLGLDANLVTTQVEPKDSLVELLHAVKRINNIVLDMDQDIWLYIMLEYFSLKGKEEEVGSSTMPHKVNPIDFENSEGNIKMANALIQGMESLQVSRLQRDLSDSTMMRNLGVVFGHSMLAYDSAAKGLAKLVPNESKIAEDMNKHPEVISEAIQVILRKEGVADAYEMLKKATRGKVVDEAMLLGLIDSLNIDEKIKKELRHLKVVDFSGLAKEIVK